MMIRWFLGLLGLFHLLNGLWMIAAPDAWYAAVPGVAMTGPANHHFIVDIGLAFAASGVGMMAAFRSGASATAFALAGATWPTLHGLFHVVEWFRDGVPHDTHIALSEGVGVMLIGFAGIALAWTRAKREGVV
jgi:hypothetical protein